MSKIIVLTVFFISTWVFTPVYAQLQLSEKRVKVSDMPDKITDFVSTNYSNWRTKYYKIKKEQNVIEYEAVAKRAKEVITATFNEEGGLIHTKSNIHYNAAVPIEVQTKIKNNLANRFKKFEIKSCEEKSIDGEISYHIELLAKKNSVKSRYLFIFHSSGEFIEFKRFPEKHLSPIFH